MGTTSEVIDQTDIGIDLPDRVSKYDISDETGYRYEGPYAPYERSEFDSYEYSLDFSNIFNPSSSKTTATSADLSAFNDMFKKGLEYANKLSLSNVGMGSINTGELLNPFYRGSRSDATLGQQQNFRQAVSKSKLGTGALQIPLSASTAPKV